MVDDGQDSECPKYVDLYVSVESCVYMHTETSVASDYEHAHLHRLYVLVAHACAKTFPGHFGFLMLCFPGRLMD